MIIERNRILTDNWSRPQFEGRIDPTDFTPRSKNPILAKFFVNIGRADELGSGVRNLYEFTRLYTGGGEPELIEGSVFKTVVPLAMDNEKLKVDLKVERQPLTRTLIEREVLSWLITNPEATLQEVVEFTGRTNYAVKAAVKNLQEAGMLRRDGSKKKGRWTVIEK